MALSTLHKLTENPPTTKELPHRLVNLGRAEPVSLKAFIDALESELGVEADKEYLPMQDGDVLATYADVTRLKEELAYEPQVSLKQGVKAFVEWYKSYVSASQKR